MSNRESNRIATDAPTMVQEVGLRRLGKYELIARIGEGGMAEVYLARQRGPMDFEKVVVVKTIHPHLSRKQKFIDMLLDEARIAARLKHPAVVDIYDLGIEEDTYFIAMEHLAGETLLSVLRACVKQKPLDVPCTARIIADAAEGLHAAHELKDNVGQPLELVHRDITPGNIVVLYTGQVKILDFGIAKARGRLSDETDADHFKGKLGYISPEQVQGEAIDRRSDVFSLGVVMWEALALRRLFRKSNPAAAADAILKSEIPPPSKYRAAVPAKLDSICLRALARDPKERYATAAELQEDIERFLAAGSFRPYKAAVRSYMHEMFADRIEEREQLLQRVVVATSEFIISSQRQHNTDPNMDSSGGGTRAVVDLPSGPVSARLSSVSGVHDNTPSGVGERHSGAYPLVPSLDPAKRRKRQIVGGAVAAVVVVLLSVMALTTDDKPKTAAVVPADTVVSNAPDGTADPKPGTDSLNPVQAQPGEPVAGVAAIAREDAGVLSDSAAQGDEQQDAGVAEDSAGKPESKPVSKKVRRRSSSSSAKELYDEGIKSFVAGKLDAAAGKFRAAIKARPGYAPAYRGLGLVYERQGKKKDAAAAFRKYLKLAPDARDSDSIRKRLSALGG